MVSFYNLKAFTLFLRDIFYDFVFLFIPHQKHFDKKDRPSKTLPANDHNYPKSNVRQSNGSKRDIIIIIMVNAPLRYTQSMCVFSNLAIILDQAVFICLTYALLHTKL